MKSINVNTMKLWKKGFSILLLTALALALFQSFAPAKLPFAKQKTERSKVVKKDFDAKAEVSASHEHGPLVIKKSADGRIHMEAEIWVAGTDEESIEQLLNRFDMEAKETSDKLELKTNMGIQNWSKINDRATIKFCDGGKLKGINDFKVNMTLYLPETKQLNLASKYDQISLADGYNGNLAVNLYSGDLVAGDLRGDFDLDMKYSKAKLGSVGKAKWVIYDSEVLAGHIQEATVSSKYSEYRLGPVAGDLTLETYDEQWRMGDVGGKLRLNDKYSEFKFGDLSSADIQIFDGLLEAKAVGELNITDTKYTEYRFASMGKMNIGNVFDDGFEIGELQALNIDNSKYTEFRVGKLDKVFMITQSFDDAVKIDQVMAGFSNIQLDGKYTEVEMGIADDASFEFSLDMKYGKADYPGSKVNITKQIEKDGQLTIQGSVGTKQTGAQNSILKVTGFDNTVTWR
jgi:hypothetical protein